MCALLGSIGERWITSSLIEILMFIFGPCCVTPTPLSTHQPTDNQSYTLTLIPSDYQTDFPVAWVSDLFTQSYIHALKFTLCSCAYIPSATAHTHTYMQAHKQNWIAVSLSPPPPLNLLHPSKKASWQKKGSSHTPCQGCWQLGHPVLRVCTHLLTDWPALFRLIGIWHLCNSIKVCHIKRMLWY